MTVKMGFIGFGKSANRYHLPYVMIRETLEVKTIFDLHVNEKAAAPFKEKGVNFTTDLNELLTDPEIELITICTPAHTHYDLAKQAILAGKSVIVEKPFCDTLEHAEELFALGQEKRGSSDALSKSTFRRRLPSDEASSRARLFRRNQ